MAKSRLVGHISPAGFIKTSSGWCKATKAELAGIVVLQPVPIKKVAKVVWKKAQLIKVRKGLWKTSDNNFQIAEKSDGKFLTKERYNKFREKAVIYIPNDWKGTVQFAIWGEKHLYTTRLVVSS